MYLLWVLIMFKNVLYFFEVGVVDMVVFVIKEYEWDKK